jgi:hypothetical protein
MNETNRIRRPEISHRHHAPPYLFVIELPPRTPT